MADNFVDNLINELKNIEGTNNQNYTSGARSDVETFMDQYSNRLFGAPFQLLDSVDRRFPEINPNLGNEYLRNFMLNSPILHIRPGMPKYTGDLNETSLLTMAKRVYNTTMSTAANLGEVILAEFMNSTIFRMGKKLQSRMFGFRETYYAYIQHVNYMCRSVATYMNLVGNSDLPLGLQTNYSEYEEDVKPPTGCYVSAGSMNGDGDDGFRDFAIIDWQDYRMTNRTNKFANAGQSNQIKGYLETIGLEIAGNAAKGADFVTGLFGGDIPEEWKDIIQQADNTSILTQIESKLSSVEFMVEPIAFNESLTNTTADSFIESTIDGINSAVGSEIAWITNSNADVGIIDNLVNFLGDGAQSATQVLGDLVQHLDGGFVSNLFSGAISALRGQKMIYPKIYKSSESHMDYQFSITLTTPYGDPYNYYMNIVVPLLHLIALAAPRMVTSNTVTSPFIVQAYIPGMCTCQLGIIQDMRITKNPTTKHVSVDGFPLTVKVEFTIEELYNAMAISPANDPVSFLYNETLNDYLCNMAGLVPSLDTYATQRIATYQAENRFFDQGLWFDSALSGAVESIENAHVPDGF